MQILMCSRRTVMSGEVVTFATEFEEKEGVFGSMYSARGPFDVSASRDAVMVHRAECKTAAESAALTEAIEFAEAARAQLSPDWRGGRESLFPGEPTATKPAMRVKPNAAMSGPPPAGPLDEVLGGR